MPLRFVQAAMHLLSRRVRQVTALSRGGPGSCPPELTLDPLQASSKFRVKLQKLHQLMRPTVATADVRDRRPASAVELDDVLG